MKDLKFIDDKL